MNVLMSKFLFVVIS